MKRWFVETYRFPFRGYGRHIEICSFFTARTIPTQAKKDMQDNNTHGNEPFNPFQLNLNEIKPVGNKPDTPPVPSQPIEPQPVTAEKPVETQSVEPQPPIVETPPVVPQPVESQPLATTSPVVQGSPSETTDTVSMPKPYDGGRRLDSIMVMIITVVALLGILVVSYWSTIFDLADKWENNVDYHHGYFVVPFVIYFLWSRRQTFPMERSKNDIRTGIILGTIIMLFWGYCRFKIMALSMVSLDSWTILLWVIGVCLMCFGTRVFCWAFPSLLFLAFMFPWPYSVENMLREPLQVFAAKLSVFILQLCGEPAVAQANVVLMSDNQRLDVAAACSGIRVLVSVIAAAYATVLLMRRPWWQNILLFCLVIPIALVVNAIRIAVTGLLIKHFSGWLAGFHFKKEIPVVCDEISGYIMLVLTFLGFILIIMWFSKVFRCIDVSQQQTRIRQE